MRSMARTYPAVKSRYSFSRPFLTAQCISGGRQHITRRQISLRMNIEGPAAPPFGKEATLSPGEYRYSGNPACSEAELALYPQHGCRETVVSKTFLVRERFTRAAKKVALS